MNNFLSKISLLVLLIIVLQGCERNPKTESIDTVMLKNFSAHKGEIDSLLISIKQFNIYKFDASSVVPEKTKIDPKQLSELRKSMENSKVSGAIRIDHEIRFYSHLVNTKRIDYGYSYLAELPKDSVNTLDTINCSGKKNIYYRHIENNWFAFGFCNPNEI